MSTSADAVVVRMGELACSSAAGETLMSIGLGSCVAVAMLDPRRRIVGLAHVMLPFGDAARGPVAKYAHHGVPELTRRLHALGAVRLEAVLVGGAQMFGRTDPGQPSLHIGQRNEVAVRGELKRLGVPVRAAATGGSRGRTIRVHVDGTRVTVREAAGADVELYAKAA